MKNIMLKSLFMIILITYLSSITLSSYEEGDNFSISAIGASNIFGISHDSDDNTLYIIDLSQEFIYHVNKSGSNLSGGIDISATTQQPWGVEINTTENTFWVTDTANDEVYKFNSAGTSLTNFDTAADGAATPQGLVIDPSDNTLWFVDRVDRLMYHYSTDGTLLGTVTTDNIQGVASAAQPTGLTINPSDNTFWITFGSFGGIIGYVGHINSTGSNLTGGFDSGLGNKIKGITFDTSDSSLWITDNTNTNIFNYVLDSSCSCPVSGNWEVDAADNCDIISECNIGSNTLTISGTGNFTINADITCGRLELDSNAQLINQGGDGNVLAIAG